MDIMSLMPVCGAGDRCMGADGLQWREVREFLGPVIRCVAESWLGAQ